MFIADFFEFRTYDPKLGIELIASGESNGELHYELIRSDGVRVHFATRSSSTGTRERLEQTPSSFETVVHRVMPKRGRFPSRSRILTDVIIRQALTAYKAWHGLPITGTVTVLFEQTSARSPSGT
jgi:hypothetical protein